MQGSAARLPPHILPPTVLLRGTRSPQHEPTLLRTPDTAYQPLLLCLPTVWPPGPCLNQDPYGDKCEWYAREDPGCHLYPDYYLLHIYEVCPASCSLDDSTWRAQLNSTDVSCAWFAEHDPGCTVHADIGQLTRCRTACWRFRPCPSSRQSPATPPPPPAPPAPPMLPPADSPPLRLTNTTGAYLQELLAGMSGDVAIELPAGSIVRLEEVRSSPALARSRQTSSALVFPYWTHTAITHATPSRY